ncbi:MAG: hypothetical protein JWM14_313 [Chitinophagaceae bacterium]|nr:hypothetical protein [Chitinophagaceae bacterium]
MDHLSIIVQFLAFELAVVFLVLFCIDFLAFQKSFIVSLRSASLFHLRSAESIRYLKAVLTGLAALCVWIDFINYQDFEHLIVWQVLTNWLLLISLLFLTFRQWIAKVNGITYWIASFCFFICLLIKLRLWLFDAIEYSPVYWTHIIMFSAPLVIVFSDLAKTLQLTRRFCVIAAASFLVTGLIYKLLFVTVSYLDASDEAFELQLVHSRNLPCFYYLGCILFIVAWIRKPAK